MLVLIQFHVVGVVQLLNAWQPLQAALSHLPVQKQTLIAQRIHVDNYILAATVWELQPLHPNAIGVLTLLTAFQLLHPPTHPPRHLVAMLFLRSNSVIQFPQLQVLVAPVDMTVEIVHQMTCVLGYHQILTLPLVQNALQKASVVVVFVLHRASKELAALTASILMVVCVCGARPLANACLSKSTMVFNLMDSASLGL